jgi:hypothetical protein
LAAQARAQTDQATAAHKAQLEQQKAQSDAIHQQIKIQAEIELARIKAELDAGMAMLDAHLKAATEQQKIRHAQAQHHVDVAETALGMAATAQSHDVKMQQMRSAPGESND